MKLKVEKTIMTKEVINSIIELDKDFYLDFDYSNPNWYFERYNENNEITLLKVDDKIVGYYLFIEISKNLFDDICDLKYTGDYNFPNIDVNVHSGYYYIPSVLVNEKYREFSSILIRELFSDLQFKNNVVAIAVSNEGKKMCSRLMTYVGSPEKNIYVYKKESTIR